jgi:hypothetical protein
MGVEMDGDAHALLQRLHQRAGGGGFQQPGHILDGEDMAPRRLQFPGELDVIIERVFRPRRVEDVAGIADRALGQLARLAHRVDGDPHILDPVEAIEDAEQIDPARRRLGDEEFDDVVRIVLVADAVGAAQQHLQQDVGHALAQQG